MTAQQQRTINTINAKDEAQRVSCQLNSRPVLTPKARAQSLATAMLAAKAAGDLDAARALAIELRPLLSYLD